MSYVNVQPDAVLLTDVSNGLDGIKGTVDGRPSGAIDEEWQVTLALVPNNQTLQFSGYHPAPNQQEIEKKLLVNVQTIVP